MTCFSSPAAEKDLAVTVCNASSSVSDDMQKKDPCDLSTGNGTGDVKNNAQQPSFPSDPDPSPDPSSPQKASDASSREEAQVGTDYFHPADMAEHLENLPLEKQISMLRGLPTEEAAEALAELDEEQASDVLESLCPEEAAQIVAEMSPDDAADVLDELEEWHRDRLLKNLDQEDAEELRNLMAFDPETAGGIMNPDTIMVQEDMTADEAILEIRKEMEDKEIPYYAYVVDDDVKLMGVLSLRDLMLAKPRTLLRNEITDQDVIAVRYDVDKEEVARRMSHYNFAAMPVVDYEGKLLGVVTYDDILDVMEDAATEDMLGMVGAGLDETIDTPLSDSVKMRLPWLMVNLITSAMSAFVVYLFESSIASMAALAVLMPMVANQAGNTGQQALAVMIRQLATERRFESRRAWGAVLREGKLGACTGLFMAIAAFLGVTLLTGKVVLGIIMGGALLFDMMLGALAGGAIPLLFRALGRDPAQASSIFLTAITDSCGFFIFLGLATLFLL